MENRNGLVAGAETTLAAGTADFHQLLQQRAGIVS
jgi:hypothetical protein